MSVPPLMVAGMMLMLSAEDALSGLTRLLLAFGGVVLAVAGIVEMISGV